MEQYELQIRKIIYKAMSTNTNAVKRHLPCLRHISLDNNSRDNEKALKFKLFFYQYPGYVLPKIADYWNIKFRELDKPVAYCNANS